MLGAVARLLAFLATLAFAPLAQAAGPLVDLALVLAVDISRSIDQEEYELQRNGYAAAFRDRRVVDAIRSGAEGAIAVTYVHWSGARSQEQVVPWTVIAGAADAQGFAARIAATERAFPGGSTGVGAAIDYSAQLLATSGIAARRRIIDVSGDGSNNSGRQPSFARDEAVAAGIVINGLAILSDEPMLDHYYRVYVAGGPGSFVIAAADFESFAEAILAKLIREIALLTP